MNIKSELEKTILEEFTLRAKRHELQKLLARNVKASHETIIGYKHTEGEHIYEISEIHCMVDSDIINLKDVKANIKFFMRRLSAINKKQKERIDKVEECFSKNGYANDWYNGKAALWMIFDFKIDVERKYLISEFNLS